MIITMIPIIKKKTGGSIYANPSFRFSGAFIDIIELTNALAKFLFNNRKKYDGGEIVLRLEFIALSSAIN